MPISIEVTAKKVQDAINDGLAKLNRTIDDDDIKVEILAQGGLFRKAKVRLTLMSADPVEEKVTETSRQAEKAPSAKENAQPVNEKAGQDKKERQPVHTAAAKPSTEQEKKPEKKNVAKKRNDRPAPTESHFEKEKREERPHDPVTEEIAASATEYLAQTVKLMGYESEIKSEIKDGQLYLDIVTDNSAVIGYRGETLDSLEYLTMLFINKDRNKFYKINLNSNGYREKREKMLVELAHRMAEKCVKQNRKVVLEPMNNSGRKIIHAALADDNRVITRSEGREPSRRVVIFAVRNRKNKNSQPQE